MSDAEHSAAGTTLRCGFAALSGWTNVGKSTLLNRMLGEKVAAVAQVPQTTRNRITGVRTLRGRGQIVFVDTPGFHRPRHQLNRNMVELARECLLSVDVVLLLFDAARGLGAGDREAAELLRRTGKPALALLNKIDLVSPKSKLLPMLDRLVNEWRLPEVLPISALTGDGCDVLTDRLLELLPVGPLLFPEDYLTDQPERALAAEWIRESLLRRTREEIPHAVAVEIERWSERRDGLVEIDASVLVERESQKAIVIGRQGGLLKEVGREAREELERLLDARVFLQLWVRVRRGWRNDDRALRRLGLG